MIRGSHGFAFLTALLALACGSRSNGNSPSVDGGAHGEDADAQSRDGNQPRDGAANPGSEGATSRGAVQLPPVNGSLDYQLGGAYVPPAGVNVVSRDRTASPAPGIYSICYLNGFQVQPGERQSWDDDLILHDKNGKVVIDEDWDEELLDVSTADKRSRIADVLGGWIDGCAGQGFDALEIDNLDSYSRAPTGLLSADDAVAFMKLLSARAHGKGLAIAQKNSTDLLARRAEMGTDFAVAEQCSEYDECQDYVSAYGAAVLMIEYRKDKFEKGCSEFGATHAIVLRDPELVPSGQSGYVYEGC